MKRFKDFINEQSQWPENEEEEEELLQQIWDLHKSPESGDKSPMGITKDIESDLGEMSPEEGIDYLKNIIEFCNSEINNLRR